MNPTHERPLTRTPKSGYSPNVDKVCSYAGLVPTNHQSGDVSYQGRMKKDCNALLKEVLVEASWAHRRHATRSDVSKLGRRVSRRRGPGKGAAAPAHKLLKIVYAVLRRQSPYTPERPSRERGAAVSSTAALV
ncbi:MAG: transposase [Methanobacteriota archaeon]